jgi:glycosyltransferase involved in cell wall biosynthesis
VHAAIDLAEWHPVEKTAAREQLGLAVGDWVVALIGRVQFWQKRQDLAVKGLALARREVPNLKLLLVGDGPDLVALKELVRSEGVEDSVVFAGWTDGLSPIYSAIDALVIPSRYEGVPLVMLQAMHFGRPVIASAVDGMLDTLPQHWLFASGDAAALAARLVDASRASENELLDAQREKVARNHSMPVFERAFLAALLSALGRLEKRPKTNY